MESLYVQSRRLEAKDLKWIRRLIDAHPVWNRTKLSQHIAERWEWRNHAGQLKDMACRSMLLKLEQKGLISLPARQKPSNNGCAFRPVAPPMAQALVEPIESQLSMLEPLCIVAAQSPKSWLSLTGFCGVIIICLTAEQLVRTSSIWLSMGAPVRWPACFTGQRRGSSQFVTSSSAGVKRSAKSTCAT